MKLFNRILPIASGYFGVSSALYPLGGLILTFGPAGGAWHINIEDEPRWYRGKTTVVGAGLCEIDVVLGRDQEWIRRITTVVSDLKPSFVAICGTPISAIIGVDLKSMAKAVESKTGIPVFFVDTKGSESYLKGAEKAFLSLAKTFLKSPRKKRRKALNVLGALHLDIGKDTHLTPIIDALTKRGWEVLSCWGVENSLLNIKKSTEASVNLVITASGIKVANYMYEKFGIPYILGFPVGEGEEASFLKALDELCEGKTPCYMQTFKGEKDIDKKVLIVGEPIISCSIRQFFKNLGFKEAKVVSVIGSIPETAGCVLNLCTEKPDYFFYSEAQLARLLNDPEFDLVIGDPVYENLLTSNKAFLPLPHPAISGRLFWNFSYEFIGSSGEHYFTNSLTHFGTHLYGELILSDFTNLIC